MMSTRLGRLVLIAAIAASVGIAAGPALTAPVVLGNGTLVKGWGRLEASGTLAAVDPRAGTVMLAMSGPARMDQFEGGGVWRRRTMSGTHAVHLLPGTLVIDTGRRRVVSTVLHAGESTVVWAIVRPDAAILALTIQMTDPRLQATKVPGLGPLGTSGIVIARTASTLDLLTSGGVRRSVVLTSATAVTASGRLVPAPSLSPYDVLNAFGPVNSDGSIVATRIDVTFAPETAAQISGQVEARSVALGTLVVAGAMTCTSTETFVLHGASRLTVAAIDPGASLSVYGVPIMDGETPVGMLAHVVVVR
jgi:hypothetical protein